MREARGRGRGRDARGVISIVYIFGLPLRRDYRRGMAAPSSCCGATLAFHPSMDAALRVVLNIPRALVGMVRPTGKNLSCSFTDGSFGRVYVENPFSPRAKVRNNEVVPPDRPRSQEDTPLQKKSV